MTTRNLRNIEIDELRWFIRTADIASARQSLLNLLDRGEQVSREIIRDYQQLEGGRP